MQMGTCLFSYVINQRNQLEERGGSTFGEWEIIKHTWPLTFQQLFNYPTECLPSTFHRTWKTKRERLAKSKQEMNKGPGTGTGSYPGTQ